MRTLLLLGDSEGDWKADEDKRPLVQSQQYKWRSCNEMEMESTCTREELELSHGKAGVETLVCCRSSGRNIRHRVACWRFALVHLNEQRLENDKYECLSSR